jgi:hypothetical protein
MSDRESNTPSDGTAELPPAERTGTARTEPIAPEEPSPPPPPGGYASIRSRRGRPGIPGGLVIVAIVILAAAFVLGFFVGKSQAPETAASTDRVEQGGGKGQQQDGGGREARRKRRKACRRAVDLSAQVIEGQRQALENQAALVEAIVAEQAEQAEALTSAGEQLRTQIAQAQAAFEQALQRCRA